MPTDKISAGKGWGVAIALIVPTVIGVLFHCGLFDELEYLLYDIRFRYFSSIGDSHQLAIIAIDDSSLESIGDWPWRRDYIGRIVETVSAFGARVVLLDFIYRKPKEELVRTSDGRILTEDKCFAGYLGRGKSILAFMFENEDLSDEERRIKDYIKKDPFAKDIEIASSLKIPISIVKERLSSLRKEVLRDLAVEFLEKRSLASLDDFLKERFSLENVASVDSVREGEFYPVVKDAFDYAQAYLILKACGQWKLKGKLPRIVKRIPPDSSVVVPVETIAASARDFGFVNFGKDLDGKVRKIQMLTYYDGGIFKQFALAGFIEAMGYSPEDIKLGEDGLLLKSSLFSLYLPLDKDGRLIVNWRVPKSHKWEDSFDAIIPAALILEYSHLKERSTFLAQLARDAKGIAVKRFLPAKYERYRTLKGRIPYAVSTSDKLFKSFLRNGMEGRLYEFLGKGQKIDISESEILEKDLLEVYNKTIEEIKQIEKEAVEQLNWLYSQIDEGASGEDIEEIKLIWEAINNPDKIEKELEKLNGKLEEYEDYLKGRIEDRLVLVGYTASTLADFVSSPVYESLPGVLVHANILNQMIQQRFLTETEKSTELLVILILGMIVGFIGLNQSVFKTMLWTLVILLSFIAASIYAFMGLGIVANIAGPSLSVIISWVAIGMFRQFTEGRAKRAFMNKLGQYTSSSLVKAIAANPRNLLLQPEERVVSCFFCDLEGFTRIAEKLAPENVVRLLNVYFEDVSGVLYKYDAFINKFQGDGVFAFFNPPVNPQPDHAERACRAAIDVQHSLGHIKARLVKMGLLKEEDLFRIRVGISSGKAVVGDCGSSRKFDYTCLGDTVNIAARLEVANKLFDSRIIICEDTRRLLDDSFICRMLGKVRVQGREEPIFIYELLGSEGLLLVDNNLDEGGIKDFVKLFDKMVECFLDRDLERAEELLLKLKGISPNDGPVLLYEKTIKKVRKDISLFNDGVLEVRKG